jgi:hypothetical protein
MTYEYRSGSQALELPNPYTIENRIRFAVGGVFLVAGIALLFLVRHDLLGRSHYFWLLPLLSSVVLLVYGIRTIIIGLLQLRFFFGRERPGSVSVNLAPLQQKDLRGESMIPEVAHNKEGESVQARAFEETIRRGALPFAEPKGPVNGLLYRWYRGLIYAVTPLRQLAEKQFKVLVITAAILLSFAVSWVLATGTGALQVLALLYFWIAVVTVLMPLKWPPKWSESNNLLPMGLILLAIVAPAFLMLLHLPEIRGLHPVPATLSLLLLAGAAAAMFFVALRAQLGEPPPASSSVHQTALSMNCHPAQVSEELARILQNNWKDQIPNRHYLNKQPKINTAQQGSGDFVSEMLEETQPFPIKAIPPQAFSECLADSARRPVLVLQLYGAALLTLSALGLAIAAWWFTPARLDLYSSDFINLLSYLVIGFVVGRYCFNGAHILFGRFDFESIVYWVESRGNYQVASANYGNVLSDRIHTNKSLINIETATLRVWIVELHTVVFGKDGERFIRSMTGRADDAKALADALIAFASNQSVVVAPSALQDMDKMAGMAQLSGPIHGPASPQAIAAVLPHRESSANGEPAATS